MPTIRSTSGLVKGTALLTLSGVIAGSISALATPIYAHLYTPEQLGYGALMLAIASSILPLTTWRLEYAIVLAKDEREVEALLKLCFIATTICVLLLGVATWWFHSLLGFLLPSAVIMHIPALVFSLAIISTASYFFTRQQRYITLGLNQIVQALVRSMLIVMLAVAGFEQGVAHGYLLAASVTAVMCAIQMHSNTPRALPLFIDVNALYGTLKARRDLVLHSLTTNFLNGIAGNLMPIVFSAYFTARAAGYLFVLQQLIAAPVQIIAQAFWRTMFSHLGRCHEEAERARIVKHVYDIATPLLLIPVLTVMCFIDDIRQLVRGDWKLIVDILGPFVALVYFGTVSNITSYFVSFEKFHAESKWNVASLALRTGAVIILPIFLDSMMACIKWYLLISCAVYFSLNAYWATVLRNVPRFFYNNLMLVVPVFGLGIYVSRGHASMLSYAIVVIGIAGLTGLAALRFRRINIDENK
jgi:O-antigen/teichoic acid export membrane protein